MTDEEPERTGRHSKGFLLEGLTIVLSILLAFAIDAWWDTIRSRSEQERLLDTVEVELATNQDRLERILNRGDEATAAGRTLVDLIGPATEPVGFDSLGSLLGRLFDVGGARLQMVATDALLAEAHLDSDREAELFRALSLVRSANDKYLRDAELSEQQRERVLTYLSGIPGTIGPSDFPRDPLRIQRDHQLESLVGNMFIRANSVNMDAHQLVALVDSARTLLGVR